MRVEELHKNLKRLAEGKISERGVFEKIKRVIPIELSEAKKCFIQEDNFCDRGFRSFFEYL